MANKDDFTPEEWDQLVAAPQMAAFYVAFASPSGPVGSFKEMAVYPRLIVEAIENPGSNNLIQAVAVFFKDKIDKREMPEMPKMGMDIVENKAKCMEVLRGIVGPLTNKAPAEAEGFMRWVYQAAVISAEAAKEGGFLGIGGVKVNEAEAAALKEIAGVLGIQV